MSPDHYEFKLKILRWDLEMWYSYVTQGLRGEIEGNTRKDQRTYQRKYCAAYSRLHKFIEKHPEYLV